MTIESERDRLIDAALGHAIFDGMNDKAIAAAARDLDDLREEVAIHQRTGRIVGVVEADEFRAGRGKAAQLGKIRQEAVLGRQLENADIRPEAFGDRIVLLVGGQDRDDAVAGLHQRLVHQRIGADRAILVETTEELQPLAVAKLLKALVDKEQPQLIILGKQAIDDDANQVGQMLAALCDLPQATFASKVELTADKVSVTREVDGGSETLSLSLPAVITTDLRLNEPRYVTLPNIMKAKKKPMETVTPEDLGVDVAPRLKTLKVAEPAKRGAGIMVPDVATLVEKLKNEAKVLP